MSADRSSWLTENEPLIFWTMVILYLSPVWFFHFLPTQDGHAHLLNAHFLQKFITGDTSDLINGFYELNISPTPTWFLHLVLTGLQFFVAPVTAEKIVASLLILSLPAAARFAVGKIDLSMKPLAWIVFPMTYSHLFYFGFYAMCFSVSCYLLTLGAVLSYLRSGRRITLLLIFAGGLLCYVMHIVGFGLLVLSIGILSLGRLIMTAHRRREDAWPFITHRLLPLGIAFLPIFTLVMAFLGEKQSGFKPELDASHLLSRAMYLGLSGSTFPIRFTGPLALISVGTLFSLMLFLLLATIPRTRHLRRGLPRIILAILMLFVLLLLVFPQMYLVSPDHDMEGGGFISHRIALFIPPALMLFLASCTDRISQFLKQFPLVIALVLLTLGFHGVCFSYFNGYLMEYAGLGRHIRPDTFLVPLHLFPEDGMVHEGPFRTSLYWRFDPVSHASNRVAIDTGAVTLDNYEAAVGYFPLLYRDGMNPIELGYEDSLILREDLDQTRGFLDLIDHYKTRGFPADYILVWLKPGARMPEELAMELADDFSISARSRRGLLYEAKGASAQ